jgi:hypothetical protein
MGAYKTLFRKAFERRVGLPSHEVAPTPLAERPILESSRRALIARRSKSQKQDDGRRTMTYFTIGDFILIIPMALAGALFLGAIPCATHFKNNVLRVFGALLGVLAAFLLVEGLPALI